MGNKIFKVKYGKEDDYDVDTISAPSEIDASNYSVEYNGLEDSDILEIIEVPESEWDKVKVKIWEDNDLSKKPFYNTLRELHSANGVDIIASTNMDWL